ncbi:MAG: hypothetical protein JXX29_04645 [Deltaproteobacteria bacterium]|nr:hypothetical protein [Deltaproteobacteria bacterium]MBN2670934.1 hypothetical protein [Deltaproteobacteria bacterium]
MKSTKTILISLLCLLWIAGCGGADVSSESSLKERALADTPEDYDPVDAVLGTNPDLDIAAVDEMEQQEQQDAQAMTDGPVSADKDYIGGDMAVFAPTVVANGEEIAATYKVAMANDEGTVIMENVRAGVETEITPGVYDITFTTNKIAGKPEMTLRGIELEAGRRLTRQVKFPVGEITLDTPGNGCRRGKIMIRQKGASNWMPGNYSTCTPIKLMAGEYEAKQGHIEISGIQVYDGGTRTVSIRNQ